MPRERLHSPRPRLHPRPRNLEHGPHGDPDRAAVQRIRAGGGHQHRVDSQARSGAEDGADVRVVDQPLQDDDPPRAAGQRCEQFLRRLKGRAVHRRDRPSVEMEAGDRLQSGFVAHVHGDVPSLGVSSGSPQRGGQLIQPAFVGEDGPGAVAGRDGPNDHLGRLGHVESVVGFELSSQGDVGEAGVVLQTLVPGVGNRNQHWTRVPHLRSEAPDRIRQVGSHRAAGRLRRSPSIPRLFV